VSWCNRTKCVPVEREDCDGEIFTVYENVSECNFIDTSLHTYKCATCGESFFYSYRARVASELELGEDVFNPEVDKQIKKNGY
jgi:hypothetical protein